MRLLGTGRLADQIATRLDPSGPVVVAGDNKLAKALAARSIDVAVADSGDKSAAKLDLRRVTVDDLEPDSVAGAVIAAVAGFDDGVDRVRALVRVVAPGGVLVLLDKGPRVRASQCALLGGLSRLRQEITARTVVTSGIVI